MQDVQNQTQNKLWYISVFCDIFNFISFYVLFRECTYFLYHKIKCEQFSQPKSVHSMKSKSNRKYFIQKVPITLCISFFVCESCDIIKKKKKIE